MFNNANILITGATGSFGQKCVEMILKNYKARRIVVFSRDECKQFHMQQEFNDPCMRYFLGDIRDRDRLMRAFTGIDYVIHAAAVKQVPALEYNPQEAIKTNILGSQNVIEASIANNVKKVVALSTDKAASPINLYGATKLVADKIFTAANNTVGAAETRFSVVRYGNVIASRGSVIPFFQKLVDEGKTPLPVTDKEMTRFFLTREQGVDFVFKAFQRMRGGEIFVPKIPSMNILDLVEAMSGTREHKEIGIRPGEKVHEVLIPRDDSSKTIEFEDFFILEPVYHMHNDEITYLSTMRGEKGKSVPVGFKYSSDNNPNFFSVDDIKKLVNDTSNL